VTSIPYCIGARSGALFYASAALARGGPALDHDIWQNEPSGELSIVIDGLWLVIRQSSDCARFRVFREPHDGACPDVLLASGTEADVSAAKIAARRTAMRIGTVTVTRVARPAVMGEQ
jgi:hypothetical protein